MNCNFYFIIDLDFQHGKIEIHMKVDGSKFTDFKKIIKDIQRTPAWTFDKSLIIKSKEERGMSFHL